MDRICLKKGNHMTEQQYNKTCFDFQEKIINIFNQQNLPFLIKYFLFKQIWKAVKNSKKQIDLQMQKPE